MSDTNFDSAKKMADEFMTRALEQDWSAMFVDGKPIVGPGRADNVPAWVKDAARAMDELSPEACMVHIIRLTDISNAPNRTNHGDDPTAAKKALASFNLALAACEDFNSAMKKLHELKATHGRDDYEWLNTLKTAAR